PLVRPAIVSGTGLAALCAERVLLSQRVRVALRSLGIVGWQASLVARGAAAGSDALGPVPTTAGLVSVAMVLISYGPAWSEPRAIATPDCRERARESARTRDTAWQRT